VIIALVAAFVGVGLIGLLMFALLTPSPQSPPPPPVAVAVEAAPPAFPPPAPAPAENKEVDQLHGTWVATAVTIDGEAATDEEVAKVKLTMDKEGFKLVLPTTQREGRNWATGFVTPKGIKGILFLPGGDDDMRGIYEVDGDTLKVCLTALSDKWPDDFTAKKGSKRTLLVLKRNET